MVGVETDVEVIGYFQPHLFQAGERTVAGPQLDCESAPARFALDIVVRVAGLGVTGQRPSFVDGRRQV